ncbi:MAG: O-antigen ligase family protein [Actinobacteria bacterium]|nr:O-antigen ligase family protein [Actinomycetota bacterium]
MLIGTSAFLRFVQPDEAGIADADPSLQAVWFALYLAAGGLLVGRALSGRPLRLPDPFLLGLVLIAVASTAWGANPEVTARRSLALVGTALVGTLIASTWSFESVLRLVRWVMATAAFASIVVAGSPSAYDRVHVEALRGVFFHRNGLGRAMAFAVLAVLLEAYLRRRVLRSDIALLVLFLSLVALSRSATAIVVTTLTLSMTLVLPLLARTDLRLQVIGVCLLGAAAVVAAVGFAGVEPRDVAQLIGRDATFTGRTAVWAAAGDSIADRAVLGHGFAGFWVAGYPPAMRVAAVAHFPGISQGHNGFIDILLQLGLLGLAAIGASIVLSGRRLWHRLRNDGDRTAAAMGAVLVFVLFTNLTESSFQQHSFFMMVLVAVSASAARPGRRVTSAVTPLAQVGAVSA